MTRRAHSVRLLIGATTILFGSTFLTYANADDGQDTVVQGVILQDRSRPPQWELTRSVETALTGCFGFQRVVSPRSATDICLTGRSSGLGYTSLQVANPDTTYIVIASDRSIRRLAVRVDGSIEEVDLGPEVAGFPARLSVMAIPRWTQIDGIDGYSEQNTLLRSSPGMPSHPRGAPAS